MTDLAGRVAWIAIAPVKSMALCFLERAQLGMDGIPGDRAFALIDERGRLVNGKRAGPLATVRVERDVATGSLTMRFPDGTTAAGVPQIGTPVEAWFFGEERPARAVEGPWTGALRTWSGMDLRMVSIAPGHGPDHRLTTTLLSSAALAELAAVGGAPAPLDRRRFRMSFGIDGITANAEDRWIGQKVRIGGAVARVAGNVGRCATTTHDPDTGRPSFDTLAAIQRSRGHLPSTEPLPFGVHAEVLSPGPVSLGDPIEPVG